jgi:hypothetical protein
MMACCWRWLSEGERELWQPQSTHSGHLLLLLLLMMLKVNQHFFKF